MQKKNRKYSIVDPVSKEIKIFDSYREAALEATKNNTIIGCRIYFTYD